jgi:hypothetical protein
VRDVRPWMNSRQDNARFIHLRRIRAANFFFGDRLDPIDESSNLRSLQGLPQEHDVKRLLDERADIEKSHQQSLIQQVLGRQSPAEGDAVAVCSGLLHQRAVVNRGPCIGSGQSNPAFSNQGFHR